MLDDVENKKEIKKNIKSMGYLRQRFMAGFVAFKKIERFQVILHNYAASFWS